MKKSLKLISASLLLLASSFAGAHPGHDHSSLMSQPTHLLSALFIVASLTALVWFTGFKKQKNTSTAKKG